MNASFEHWNRMVHLVMPTMADIRNATGTQERSYHTDPIQHAAALTDNLFVEHHVSQRTASNPLILSIWIVFKNVFPSGVSVKPAVLPPVMLFGGQVPCSAQAFLGHLQSSSPDVPMTLGTEPDQYTIDIGAAKLAFHARNNMAMTPDDSDLAVVTFFFSIGTTNPKRYEFTPAA